MNFWRAAGSLLEDHVWTPAGSLLEERVWTPAGSLLDHHGRTPAGAWRAAGTLLEDNVWTPAGTLLEDNVWTPAGTWLEDHVWTPAQGRLQQLKEAKAQARNVAHSRANGNGGVQEQSKESPLSHQPTVTPQERCRSSPSLDWELRESLFSSGRSSWSSNCSNTKNNAAESRRSTVSGPPALPPPRSTSPSQTSPKTIWDVGPPVSLVARTESLSSELSRGSEDVPSEEGAAVSPGSSLGDHVWTPACALLEDHGRTPAGFWFEDHVWTPVHVRLQQLQSEESTPSHQPAVTPQERCCSSPSLDWELRESLFSSGCSSWSSKQGLPITTSTTSSCGDTSLGYCDETNMRDEHFVFLGSLSELPMSPSQGEDGGHRYAHGEHWTRGHLLGSGGFASCYQARDISLGTLLAVKQISFRSGNSQKKEDREEEDRVVASIWDEIHMMASLGHPNVLLLLGATRHVDHYNVFLEWMAGGSVESMLDKYGAFSEPVILHYTREVLEGLDYLHEKQILHRDLKGANLLVDGTGFRLKIADFGVSSRLSSKDTLRGEFQYQVFGTVPFMAPEVMRGEHYGRSCDIWSLGCVMIQMATNAEPWSELMPPKEKIIEHHRYTVLIYRIGHAGSPPSIPESLSPQIRELVLRCLQVSSQERPKAGDLLSHALFRRVDPDRVPEDKAMAVNSLSPLPVLYHSAGE